MNRMKLNTLTLAVYSVCVFVFMFSACENKKEEQRLKEIKENDLQIPSEIETVSAIGRVEPIEGLIELGHEQGGKVVEILKQVGDSVALGEKILTLEESLEQNQIDQIHQEIKTQKNKYLADLSMIKQYEAQKYEKQKDISISERLSAKGAETQYSVEVKKKELEEILSQIESFRNNAAASGSLVKESELRLEEARRQLNNKKLSSPVDGRVVTMEAKIGQVVEAAEPILTIAPICDLVVHGEIDELFANRVKKGDRVEVKFPGTDKVITEAEIVFLSPILETKSLFYEKAGELADRRVRPFKAVLKNQDAFLINTKVQCTIYLNE